MTEEPEPRRLYIELTGENAVFLDAEEIASAINRTNLCNKAIELYRKMLANERAGGKVYMQEQGDYVLNRVRFL